VIKDSPLVECVEGVNMAYLIYQEAPIAPPEKMIPKKKKGPPPF
jgi:hypothetical protein